MVPAYPTDWSPVLPASLQYSYAASTTPKIADLELNILPRKPNCVAKRDQSCRNSSDMRWKCTNSTSVPYRPSFSLDGITAAVHTLCDLYTVSTPTLIACLDTDRLSSEANSSHHTQTVAVMSLVAINSAGILLHFIQPSFSDAYNVWFVSFSVCCNPSIFHLFNDRQLV